MELSSIYGYARVSTSMQADEGYSLDAQSRLIRDEAKRIKSARFVKVFRDPAVSGARYPLIARDAGRELDKALKRGDHVIFAKLDRAFRSVLDCVTTLERWTARGVNTAWKNADRYPSNYRTMGVASNRRTRER
jgi:DNA invertase Pin-like site-specific DNA recombinase